MESKTLTTLILVLVCIFLIPVLIGLVAGVFGVIGSIIGGIFGLIGGVFGAVFGVIGGILGAIFGFFGWLFDEPFHWHFSRDLVTIALIVLVVVLLSRSRQTRPGGGPKP